MPALHARACRHLAAADPALGALIARVGRCGLVAERGREPFEALVRAIAHQQLHARAAEAILGRLLAHFPGEGFPAPRVLAALEDGPMRTAGLSGAKIASVRDLCARAMRGEVPTRRASARLDDETLIERLSEIRGIGRWTVEMLLIFTLGRPDVLPVDDFGVREGYRLLHDLPEQPKPRALGEIGARWAPHRSVAAWYLWRRADEGKKIAPPVAPSPPAIPPETPTALAGTPPVLRPAPNGRRQRSS